MATKVLKDAWLVSERSVLRRRSTELLKVNSDRRAGHGVAGSNKVLDLWEEEVERAGLVCVGGRDVEVEDGREGGVDAGEVLSTEGGSGGGGGDGHNQVGVLVVAAEGGAA